MTFHTARNACSIALPILLALGCSTQQTAPPSATLAQTSPTAEPKANEPASPVPETAPVIEPKAMAALNRMGAFLRTLKTYQVGFKLSKDEVLDSGQKVMVDGVSLLTVQSPDRFHFATKIDEAHRDLQFFYDGKNFTIYGNTNKYYATAPAPATIGELLDAVQERYGLELPFRDLFVWGTDKADVGAVQSALFIGPTQIDNTPCDHYAFRNVDVDWQIWIQQGDQPLPKKLVITTMDQPEHPQYVSLMDWRLKPALDGQTFTFVPPKDAHKIKFAEIEVPADNTN